MVALVDLTVVEEVVETFMKISRNLMELASIPKIKDSMIYARLMPLN